MTTPTTKERSASPAATRDTDSRDTDTTVRFVDPRSASATQPEPYELRADLAAATIGLLANGFPDSVNFLTEVEAVLRAQLPGATFARYDKGNASMLASPEMLDEIATTCTAVVAAYGH